MAQNVDTSCSCPQNGYTAFETICARELAQPISADTIVNLSRFCTSFQIDMISGSDERSLKLRDILHGLGAKVGIYHIWVQEDYCYEHRRYSMLSVYVGKGEALGRILQRAKEELPPTEFSGVSFFECENRIAKYLEQLFLDVYKFHLNKNENVGDLFACWDEDRRVLGTELHNISNRPNAETGD